MEKREGVRGLICGRRRQVSRSKQTARQVFTVNRHVPSPMESTMLPSQPLCLVCEEARQGAQPAKMAWIQKQADTLLVPHHSSDPWGSTIYCANATELQRYIGSRHDSQRPGHRHRSQRDNQYVSSDACRMSLPSPGSASPTARLQGASARRCFHVKECRSAGVLHLHYRTGRIAEDHGCNASSMASLLHTRNEIISCSPKHIP